jgi:hypothetical protein
VFTLLAVGPGAAVGKNPAAQVGIEGFCDFIPKGAKTLLELFFPDVGEFFSAA